MQLPPLHVTRAVVQRYARLLVRYGGELRTRPLVLPNGDFFPDRFDQDPTSLKRLVGRMQHHGGLSDIPIEVALIARDASSSPEAGSCSSGACAVPTAARSGLARLVDLGDGWRLQVPEAELAHPVALTANLARSLSYVFLVETQREGEIIEPPIDVTADFIAVALGFGPLMLQGSYIYAKSCGGPSIASVTKVGVGELAIVTALFIAMGGHSFRSALRELDTTQRALLEEAQALFESNRGLVQQLSERPERGADGHFELAETSSWLSRLFTKRRKQPPGTSPLGHFDENLSLDDIEAMLINMPPASQVATSKPPASSKDPARDELKALVSEALADRPVSR